MYERGLWGQRNTHEILVFGVSVCRSTAALWLLGKNCLPCQERTSHILHLPEKQHFSSPPFISLKQKKNNERNCLSLLFWRKKRRLEKSETKGLKIGLDNKVKYFGEKGTIKGHKPPLDAISACLNSDLPKQFWGSASKLVLQSHAMDPFMERGSTF